MSESVIREMTRLAERHGALNLSQGLPDFDTPAEIEAAAIKAIRRGHNQYSFTWGSPNLRRCISEKAMSFNGIESDPDRNVTVTCGSTEAMTAAVLALSEGGDEVAFFEPAYENYVPSAILAGATPVPVQLGDGFHLDEEALRSAVGPRTKILIVNTPHNPSGAVFGRAELKAVADVCEEHNIIAITDEIYEHIIYDGRSHLSLATIGDMARRTVTISGMSKTYAATGWRVGYAIAEASLTEAIRKVHDYMTVCAPAPFQEAAAFAMKLPDSYYEGLASTYQDKRDFMVKRLRDMGFEFSVPEGSYYILADFSALSKQNDTTFATSMIADGGVASVPGSSFYLDGRKGRKRVRFSYCKKDSTLKSAVARLERWLA